jgi:hypothetical protein
MKPYDQLLKTEEFWLINIQSTLFEALANYIAENPDKIKQISEDLEMAEILNGDFDGSLSELVRTCVYLGVAPVFDVVSLDSVVETECENK